MFNNAASAKIIIKHNKGISAKLKEQQTNKQTKKSRNKQK